MALYAKRFGTGLAALGVVWLALAFLASPAWAQTAELTVDKTGPGVVVEGEEVTYTIVVSNTGAEAATAVTLTDDIPAGATFVSAENPDDTCTQAAGTVTCELGSIDPGESETVTLTLRATGSRNILNIACAGSPDDATENATDPSCPDVANDASDDATTRVAPDLVIEKFDNPDPVRVDENLTYALRVTNQGGTNATDVTVTDDLPNIPLGTVSLVDVEGGSGFECTVTSGRLRCTGGSIAPDDTARILFIVRPEEAGTINNTAVVGAEGFRNIDDATQSTLVQGEAVDLDPTDPTDPGDGGEDGNDTDLGSAEDQYDDDDDIINIPNKDLPNTGGPPLLAIFFSVVAGAGLLTALVRRRY